jgi:hypothetical protein
MSSAAGAASAHPRSEVHERLYVDGRSIVGGLEAGDRLPETEVELIASHLQPAPLSLQIQAHDLFAGVVKHYQKRIGDLSSLDRSLENCLAVADAQFMERLNQVAANAMLEQKGLLVVGDLDYQGRVDGKKFSLWQGGVSVLGTSVGVLVVADVADDQLEAIDKHYWELRAVAMAEKLTLFNAKSYDERAKEIDEYLTSQRVGDSGREFFGLPSKWMGFVRVDRQGAYVFPLER